MANRLLCFYHEYFEGDPKTMSMVINDVYADYYKTHTPVIDNNVGLNTYDFLSTISLRIY